MLLSTAMFVLAFGILNFERFEVYSESPRIVQDDIKFDVNTRKA